MTLKPPFDNLRPRYNETLTPQRLNEILHGIADNTDWFSTLFPVSDENLGATAGVVTKLPPTAGNFIGRRVLYAADKSNGIYWELVYDGEGEFPWKYIGGPPLFAEIEAGQTRTSSAYGDLTTVGPSVTVPLKGDYDVAIGAAIWDSGTVVTDAIMSYAIGASAAVDADAIDLNSFSLPSNVSAVIPGGLARPRRKTGLTAAAALVAKYRSSANSASASATFAHRWMRVTPVRVG